MASGCGVKGCTAVGGGDIDKKCEACKDGCNAACTQNCSGDCLGKCGNYICGTQCAGICQGKSELTYSCDGCQTDCGNGCGGKCVGGCKEDCKGCTGSSKCTCGSSCKGDCDSGCKDSCDTTCKNGCKETCNSTCSGSCEGNCDTSCSNDAVIEAYNKLKNLDLSQVMIGEEIDALEDMVIHEMTLRHLSASTTSQKDQGAITKKSTPQVIYNDLNTMKAYPRAGSYASVGLTSTINTTTEAELIKNYIKVVLSLYEVVVPQK